MTPLTLAAFLVLLLNCQQEGSSSSRVTTRRGGTQNSGSGGAGSNINGVTTGEYILSSTSIPHELQKKDGPSLIRHGFEEYGIGTTGNLLGYNATPMTTGGITNYLLIIHDKSGLSIAFQNLLKRFLGQNYGVFAINLFETGHPPQTIAEADRFFTNLKLNGDSPIIANIIQAADHLRAEKAAKNIGLIGFGEGGTYAAKAFVGLKKGKFRTLVNFYGDVTPIKDHLHDLPATSLHILALADPNTDQVLARTLGGLIKNDPLVPFKTEINPVAGVGNGFVEPYSEKYDNSAAQKVFNLTFEFLEQNLR